MSLLRDGPSITDRACSTVDAHACASAWVAAGKAFPSACVGILADGLRCPGAGGPVCALEPTEYLASKRAWADNHVPHGSLFSCA